eukprot:COSAG02_NODE_3732_length_6312_cov_10.672944_5_plen_51_part_01
MDHRLGIPLPCCDVVRCVKHDGGAMGRHMLWCARPASPTVALSMHKANNRK